MTEVYITHGYTANGDKHWFVWLEKALAKRGVKCHRLTMPDSCHPTPEAWLAHHQANVSLNENTILIGHSLGCIATLNFLATAQQKIKGAIFVSGFFEKLPNLPELDAFANFYANLPAYSLEKSYVLAAENDNIVNAVFSQHLAQHLGAEFLLKPTGGHFLDREGVTELPEVLAWVEALEALLA